MLTAMASDRPLPIAAAPASSKPRSADQDGDLDEELAADRRLWSRMAAGDAEAFELFFAGHFQRLYRFALAQVGGDEDLAAELAQVSICVALERLGSYRGESLLRFWLQGICRFEISAYFRRKQRRPQGLELSEETLDAAGLADRSSPENLALQGEEAAQVHRVLDSLPSRYGEVLELKYGERLSMQEIAARCGDSVKAVESLLSRARRAFKETFAALKGAG